MTSMASEKPKSKQDLPKGFFRMELISNNPRKMKEFVEGRRLPEDASGDD